MVYLSQYMKNVKIYVVSMF